LIFTDEASFRQDSTLHATWSRIGHPPEVSVTRQRKSVKILGAIEVWQARFHHQWDTVFMRQHLGEVFGKLAEQKESRIEEGHLLPDHVHMMITIPPQYAVSQVIGFIKGKSAIHLARVYGERERNFVGQHFWASGYWVSIVGRDEAVIREYIRAQEQEDTRLDQMGLWR
jgi:putative transposase